MPRSLRPLLLAVVAGAALAVAGTVPAWASGPIVVRGAGGTVRIARALFGMQFADRRGRVVLRELAPARGGPLVQAAVLDPLAPGFDNPSTAPRYAPLSFLAGSQTLGQYPGGLWGGNLRDGRQAGVWYAARRVLSVAHVRGGVRLLVSTEDPSGRRLIVVVRADGAAFRVSVAFDDARGVAVLSDAFASSPGEAFFGFGGRHDAVDQHGHLLSSFVEEENVNGLTGFEQGGGGRSLFPNGPAAAYYPQAEFFSSRGYGFLLANPQLARLRMDSDRSRAWSVEVSASRLNYLVAPQSPAPAIRTLTALSGREPVPPRWALGPMLDRLVKNVGETAADYRAQVRSDLADLVRYHVPVTAYRIEGWGLPAAGNDGLALPSFLSGRALARVVARLRARHIHPLFYLRPWVTPGSRPVREGLVVRHADGSPYYTTSTTGHPIALLDFTNPRAVRFWQREVAKVFDLGADGFMQDFGEEVLFDMHFADGESGRTMHNRYPVLDARATREEITRYERMHPGRRLWFFDRAGYSGLPGTAAYDGGTFPGDETTDWTPSSGLASLTADMLSRAVTGAYGFATDIGGYFDLASPPTSKELFLRWAEWAALSPIFRLHGSGLAGTHTPWSYDAQTVHVYNALSRLHLRAVPLILSLWREARRTGLPVTRPLWLQYPRDRAARRQDQEWLLGPDVLVAPVLTPGARSRRVYFPAGCWRSPVTRRAYRGPRQVVVRAALTQLPYFTRCHTDPLSG